MKYLFLFVTTIIFNTTVAHANTQYTVDTVRTFNQTGNCLCAAYVSLHALEVRYKQREGKEIYLNRRNVQRSQIFDRYQEQVEGYRTNAVLDNCFTEAPYPHDVFRQVAQYGIEAVPAADIESITGFDHAVAINLIDAVLAEVDQKTQMDTLSVLLDAQLGSFTGSLDFAREVLKNDKWVGYIPSASTKPKTVDFIPPDAFLNEMPMPKNMPKVISLDKSKIFKKIVKSLKNGISVPFCAGFHCKSIDGIELNTAGDIVSFYYGDTYGTYDYKWSSEVNDESAHNGFLYVIME